jgi:hypothetical protein
VGAVVEYLFGSNTVEEGPAGGPRLDRQGVWAEAAVMLWRPHLELDARYQWFDEPPTARQRWQALTVGATAYALGATLKLQFAYSHKFHLVPIYEDDVALLVLTAAY